MLRAGVGLSCDPRARQAAREAGEAALAGCGRSRAAAALVFAGPAHLDELPELARALTAVLGTRSVVGTTADGVLAAGHESRDRGLVVLALSGDDLEPFLVPSLAAHSGAALAARVRGHLGGDPSERDLVVLLPDPGAFVPGRLLPGLSEGLAPARLAGAGAGGASRPSLPWVGEAIAPGALAGLALRAASPPRLEVASSCRPVAGPFTVTRAEGHWVLELNGRPALGLYREVARAPLASDLRRAARVLLAALPRAGPERLLPSDCLVRHIAGFSEERQAIALPEPIARGAALGFALRDPVAARDELKQVLGRLTDAPPPAAVLYFGCRARGGEFLGAADLEAAYLEQAFGAGRVAGMFGSCEIGPLAGQTELLTYTAVLVALAATDGSTPACDAFTPSLA